MLIVWTWVRGLSSEETWSIGETGKKNEGKQLATIIFSCSWHSGVVVFYFLFYFLFLPMFIRPQDLVVCMMGKEVLTSQIKKQGVFSGQGCRKWMKCLRCWIHDSCQCVLGFPSPAASPSWADLCWNALTFHVSRPLLSAQAALLRNSWESADNHLYHGNLTAWAAGLWLNCCSSFGSNCFIFFSI